MLCGRGSSILVEEFCYPATLAMLRPQGVLPVGLKMDDEGLLPEEMDRVLSGWGNAQHSKPRVMIIVPTGQVRLSHLLVFGRLVETDVLCTPPPQNPSGATMSTQRRKNVYDVARKHNIVRPLPLTRSMLTSALLLRQIIVCDDPYRHLQLTYDGETPKSGPASFLELDVDKRVIELASFSKVRRRSDRVKPAKSESLTDCIRVSSAARRVVVWAGSSRPRSSSPSCRAGTRSPSNLCLAFPSQP